MTSSLTQHVFFFSLLLVVGYLMYLVTQPFLVPIFLAIVFAVLYKNAHERILVQVGNRKSLAAALAVFAVAVTIIVPVGIVGFLVFDEARGLNVALSGSTAGGIDAFSLYLENQIGRFIPGVTIDVASYLSTFTNWLLSNTSTIFTSFVGFIIDVFILLIALFFVFRDGNLLRKYIIKLSPLDQTDDEDILKKLEVTIRSVIKGALVVAAVQGIFSAIGFTIFGVGNPAILGVVSAIAALVPGLGIGLVNLPVVIYLVATGQYLPAIGFGLWSMFITGMVDNVLNPMIIKRGVDIHPFLILLSVIGGLAYFGVIGFIAGPVLLALSIELLKLYPKFISSNS